MNRVPLTELAAISSNSCPCGFYLPRVLIWIMRAARRVLQAA